MKRLLYLIPFLLFANSVFAAEFPEDRVLAVEKTKITWTLPTEMTNGAPLLLPLELVTIYCSNAPNVGKYNSPFIRDLLGTDTEYMMTNFTDGNWYCRLTATLGKVSDYSSEVNFIVVGGVVLAESYPSRMTVDTE